MTIEKITIKTSSGEIELDLNSAREVYEDLDKLFGKPLDVADPYRNGFKPYPICPVGDQEWRTYPPYEVTYMFGNDT